MRPLYRVWQFWKVVTARQLDSKSEAEIRTILSSQQQWLFGRFSAGEQQHSYRVYETLKKAGLNNRDLLVAALLHDIGKTRFHRPWWHRPVVVLGQAFFRRKAAEWSMGEGMRCARPFVIKANHAEWGAVEAETAGSSPTTIALIRYHHHPLTAVEDKTLADLLAHLQWADDNS